MYSPVREWSLSRNAIVRTALCVSQLYYTALCRSFSPLTLVTYINNIQVIYINNVQVTYQQPTSHLYQQPTSYLYQLLVNNLTTTCK